MTNETRFSDEQRREIDTRLDRFFGPTYSPITAAFQTTAIALYDLLKKDGSDTNYLLAKRILDNLPVFEVSSPIPLNIHHLVKARGVAGVSLEKHVAELEQYGHIVMGERDFFTYLTRDVVLAILARDWQKIKVTDNTPDLICFGCRKFERCYAEDGSAKNPIIGEAFSQGIETSLELAGRYNLRVGDVYFSRDIREKLDITKIPLV